MNENKELTQSIKYFQNVYRLIRKYSVNNRKGYKDERNIRLGRGI